MPAWLHAVNFELGGHLPGEGADFSVFAGMAAAAVVYTFLFALNRSRGIRRGDSRADEDAATPLT